MLKRSIGTLAVYLNGDKTQLDKTLKGAAKGVGAFKDYALKAAGAIGLAFSFTAAIQGISKLKNEMDQIGKAATNFGVSTGFFQELEYAAQRTGTSIEMVQAGFIRIKKLAGDAAAGKKSAQETLQNLGLDANLVRNMSSEELFNSVNSAIMGLDERMRSSVGAEVYGKQFEKMNNFLRDYVSLGKEAKDRGLIIRDEEIKSAEALNDAILNLERSARSIVANSGLVQWLSDLTEGADKFFKEAQEYRRTVRLGTDPDYAKAMQRATNRIKQNSSRAEKESQYAANSALWALKFAESAPNSVEAQDILQKTMNNVAGWQKRIVAYRSEYDEYRKNLGIKAESPEFKEAEAVVTKMLSRLNAAMQKSQQDEEEGLKKALEENKNALEEENKWRATEEKRQKALNQDQIKAARDIRYRYLEMAGDSTKAEMEKYINELNDRYMSQYGRGLTDEEKDSFKAQKKQLMDLDRSSESLRTLFNGNALAETLQKGSLEVYRLQAKIKDPAREEQLKLARENADAAKRAAAAAELMAQKTVGIQAANIGSVIGA